MAPVSTYPCTPEYDRNAELTAFDETKTGVKGLVDAGIVKVPRIFQLHSPENLQSNQLPQDLQSNQAFENLESKKPSLTDLNSNQDLQSNEPSKNLKPNQPSKDLESKKSSHSILKSNQPSDDLQSNQPSDDQQSNQPSENLESNHTSEDIESNQQSEVLESNQLSLSVAELNLPTIDLQGINEDPIRRKNVIDQVKNALGSWGFFQIVNHGIPISMLDDMRNGVLEFYEQDSEVKKLWYTRDGKKNRFVYNCNFDLYTAPVANWRDSFLCTMSPDPPQPDELPTPCRDILLEYSIQVKKLGGSLFELMSEALGLHPNHLSDMGCAEGIMVAGHYYPSCPQPELTIGTLEHTDAGFITILQQDHIGGLKVFHQNEWTDVPPITGALIVNVGDLIQLITNEKFVSARHKVVSNKVGPRISVASFFATNMTHASRCLEPIKELLSEDNPPKYRGTTGKEYMDHYMVKGLGRKSALSYFEI